MPQAPFPPMGSKALLSADSFSRKRGCFLTTPGCAGRLYRVERLCALFGEKMITDVVREVVSQLPGYEHRPQQLEMAELIETALIEKRHAIIEAGTGSGKSFGYL